MSDSRNRLQWEADAPRDAAAGRRHAAEASRGTWGIGDAPGTVLRAPRVGPDRPG